MRMESFGKYLKMPAILANYRQNKKIAARPASQESWGYWVGYCIGWPIRGPLRRYFAFRDGPRKNLN
jgi:hypothetical protein